MQTPMIPSSQEPLSFEKIWLMFQETDKKFQKNAIEIDRLSRLYGGISKNMGDAAEDYFYNGLSSTMQIGNIKYDIIYRNLHKKLESKEGEFDDVLVNANSVVVMEVKYKLHLNQVEKLIQEQIPKFKKLFPEYKGYKIYGGVAGFAIPRESLNFALQNGLFVLTQKGEDMTLLNGKGFKPKAW